MIPVRDPAGIQAVEPASPQSWNRYAYVANNPLSFTDPNGFRQCSKDANASKGQILCMPEPLNFTTLDLLQFAFTPTGYRQEGWSLATMDWAGRVTTGTAASQAADMPFNIFVDEFPNMVPIYGNIGILSQAANNGSWFQQGLNYLKNHPVFISVNEILAAQITVQWSTKTVCANLGAGASVPPTKAVTVGLYNNGNMSNWTNVLSSWGYSFGSNLIAGYQASTNSSGTIGGPTVSGIGLSGSYTYGGCMTVP